MPQGENLKVVVGGFFQGWQFSQCAGAIDGTHIKIIAPKDNPLDYWNRKQYHSIVMHCKHLSIINIDSWMSTLDGQGVLMMHVYWLIQIFTSKAKQKNVIAQLFVRSMVIALMTVGKWQIQKTPEHHQE